MDEVLGLEFAEGALTLAEDTVALDEAVFDVIGLGSVLDFDDDTGG